MASKDKSGREAKKPKASAKKAAPGLTSSANAAAAINPSAPKK